MFDGPITIPGPNFGDKEIEVVGTDGQTNPERLDYLQRRVGKKDFPWADMGTLYSEPLRPNVTPARFEQVMETRRCFGIGRMNFVLPRELAEPVAEIARRRMMSRSAFATGSAREAGT
jgi:hypothetical protein